MDVPRDPLGTLLGALSLLNDGSSVVCRLHPHAAEDNRWSVAVEGETRSASGPTFLEAVTSAYRGSIAELESAVQRQVNEALERG